MNISELNASLSIDIQKARWRKGISLSKVAKLMEVDINRIKTIEAEPIRTPLKDLFKILSLYEVPQEVLWQLHTFKKTR